MIAKLRSTLSQAGAAFLMLSLVTACSAPDADVTKPKAKTTPTVIANAPLTGAKNIAPKAAIGATFSEKMDNATINTTTFTLTAGKTAVKGTVNYSGSSAAFVPSAPLANDTQFTATISNGAKSAAGVALNAAHSWSFSTAAATGTDGTDDTDNEATTPTVLSHSPDSGAIKVAVNNTISVGFSEAMDIATLNAATFTVTAGSPAVAVTGTVTKTGMRAIFTPSSPLANNAVITATITTGATSAEGVALAASHSWSFTTIGVAPSALTSTPGDMTTQVAVNAPITVTFSQAMDLNTLHNTFRLTMDPEVGIPGTVTYDVATSTATFTPMSTLLNNRAFTATVSTGAKSSLGVNLIASRTWSFQTIGVVASVAFHTPDSIAVKVAIDTPILVTFDQAMDGTTIDDASFYVTQNGSAVNGTVSYIDSVAQFVPNSPLANNTVYVVTLDTSVTNALGVPLGSELTWSFTTVGATPAIASHIPSAATGITVATGISATFSEAMDVASLTGAFTVTRGNPAVNVPGTVSFSNLKAVFTPATMPLANSTLYTATITAGAVSTLGVPLAGTTTWSFTTIGTVPTVTSTSPANGAIEVDITSSIGIAFSQAMNIASITGATLEVTTGNPAVTVAGSINSPNSSVVGFKPAADLATDTTYYVTLYSGIESALNVPLASAYSFSFTTGNPVLLPVDLKTAANFSILARTAVTAVTNTTFVSGDIGMSPGYSDDITGFSLVETDATSVYAMTSAMVNGKVYAANNSAPTPSTVNTAVVDMINAFTKAGNRKATFTNAALSNVTVPTGVYRFTNSLSMTTDVTLSGSATDVWIFQIAGDVTMASDVHVVLTGGARVENVFWRVTGKVELGTGARIEGVVLAKESITLYDGAKANGRLLSQTWVKLYGNTLVNKVLYWNGLGVNLGKAHDYVILAQTAISLVPNAARKVTGNIGISPEPASFITGFTCVLDTLTGDFGIDTTQLIGKCFASDYVGTANGLGTTPNNLTVAVNNMGTAYTDAKGRAPGTLNEGAGEIGGLTLAPGVYYWSSALNISTDVYLTGSATDVWIFQVDQNMILADDKKIVLSGGALPENIYWAISTNVYLGSNSDFSGIILSGTKIDVLTGATVNGRLLSQTAVNLDSNIVTQPND